MLLGEDDLFFGGDNAAQFLRLQVSVSAALGLRFEAIHHALELLVRDANHNLAKQRSETPISIQSKSQITGLFGQTRHRFFVEAEIQNRVHHAGHRKRRAGSH